MTSTKLSVAICAAVTGVALAVTGVLAQTSTDTTSAGAFAPQDTATQDTATQDAGTKATDTAKPAVTIPGPAKMEPEAIARLPAPDFETLKKDLMGQDSAMASRTKSGSFS